MSKDWYDYQEKAAALFRSMGLDAATNVTVQGVRTTHDIDVVVKSHFFGFDITWLVECKHWKSPVSKLHVLGLREIVADTGADRGILLCEAGFQSGAIEAARLTNVQVTSLENVRSTAGDDISAMRLRELFDRTAFCRTRYWDMPKRDRIEHGVRSDVGESGYSGWMILEMANDLLTLALRAMYPFKPESMQALILFGKDREFVSVNDVLDTLTPLIDELEDKLTNAEHAIASQKGN